MIRQPMIDGVSASLGVRQTGRQKRPCSSEIETRTSSTKTCGRMRRHSWSPKRSEKYLLPVPLMGRQCNVGSPVFTFRYDGHTIPWSAKMGEALETINLPQDLGRPLSSAKHHCPHMMSPKCCTLPDMIFGQMLQEPKTEQPVDESKPAPQETLQSSNAQTQPLRVGGPQHAPLLLAGLYDTWHQKASLRSLTEFQPLPPSVQAKSLIRSCERV